MGRNLDFALGVAWWVRWRRVPLVSKAIQEAHGNFVAQIIKERLEANEKCKRGPTTWRELANLLVLDPGTASRKAHGQIVLKSGDMLAFASVLGCDIQSFFPTLPDWIAGAVSVMCDNDLSVDEARAYATYVFARPTFYNPHLDPDAVRRVHERMPTTFGTVEETRAAILSASQKVNDILESRVVHFG